MAVTGPSPQISATDMQAYKGLFLQILKKEISREDAKKSLPEQKHAEFDQAYSSLMRQFLLTRQKAELEKRVAAGQAQSAQLSKEMDDLQSKMQDSRISAARTIKGSIS